MAALVVIALVNLWFWSVSAHRIDDAPFSGFAHVFVTGCGDFEHFFHAALAMRNGRNIHESGVGGYIYPPFIAFLFMPLTYLTVKSAALAMLILNMLVGLVCTWIVSAQVIRRLSITSSFDNVALVAAVTLVLSATKLRSEIQMWQTNVLMMLAMLLALQFLDARPRLAGLLLGAAFNVKYLPVVLLPYLLLRRRFRAAAWFVVGILTFALLPALQSGRVANVRHWKTALAGLARLLGIPVDVTQIANVDPITVGHSISITSGISRVIGPYASPVMTLALIGLVALVVLGGIALVYAKFDVPLLRWPSDAAQQQQPFSGLVALEWAAVIALTLAFSPQTNPRHTCLLLMVFAPLAAMLCCQRPGGSRWTTVLATAILFLGIDLPPNTPSFEDALTWWRHVSGAGWSMVLMLPFLFMAGLRFLPADAQLRRP